MNFFMDMKMLDNDFDVLLLLPTKDCVVSPKRQKLNTNNLLTFDSSTRMSDVCLTRELTTLHSNLSQAEASGVQFCKVSPRIEELFETEERNMEIQGNAEETTVVELEVSSESHVSQTKSRIKNIIMDFSIEHVGMIPSCFDDLSTSTTIHDKRMETRLEYALDEDHVPQGIDFHNTEIKAAVMEILQSNSERAQWEENQVHVNAREEKFQSVEEQLINVQRKLDNSASEVEQLTNIFQMHFEEISPGDDTFQSRETRALSSFFENELPRYFVDHTLVNQEILNKHSVEELDSTLDATGNSCYKLHEVEFETSKENIEISLIPQGAKDRKLDDAERRIVELQDKLESMSALQKDMELQTIELIGANIRIEELTSQKTDRLNEFPEDLDTQGFVAPHQERAQIQKPFRKYLESLEQRLTLLEGKCAELSSKLQRYESMTRGFASETASDEYHEFIEENEAEETELEASRREMGDSKKVSREKGAVESSDQHQSTSDPNDKDKLSLEANIDDVGSDDDIESLSGMDPEEQKLLIKFGEFHILVSDERYFNIDWNKHRESRKGFRYSCRDCPKKFNNLTDMKDHLWSQHYGGRFKCPYCRDSVHKFKWRKNFRNHMKNDHGNGCNAKK